MAGRSTRAALARLTLLLAIAGPAASDPASHVPQALRAGDFLSTLGVATHIDYTDSQYAQIARVLDALRYLGIDRARDHAPDPRSDPVGQYHLRYAAKEGIKFIFTARGEPAEGVKLLRDFVKRAPGSITAVEGPNEVNNWPITYKGYTGTEGAQAYQADLYDLVKADPLLAHLPVIGFTDYPVHSSKADWNNGHPYARDGAQPTYGLVSSRKEQEEVDPGRPFVVTETGYHTSLTAHTQGGWIGVDPPTQAKLILNTYAEAARLGFKGAYVYQLLDGYADPEGADQEKHFGLFDLEFRPKPAAHAVHNLTRILQDDRMAEFAPQELHYAVSEPEVTKSLLLQKSTGAFALLVWNEPDLWNEGENRPIAAAPLKVKVDLSRTFASVDVFDPLSGEAPVQTFADRREVEIEVSGHPIIIEAGP